MMCQPFGPILGYDDYKLDNGPYEYPVHDEDCDCLACDERNHPEEVWPPEPDEGKEPDD